MTEDTQTVAAGQLRAADVSQTPYEFTPDLLWLGAPSEDWDQECWFDSDEGGTKYVRADIADGMVEALKSLLDLNDNHGPFGGELYQDRIDRAWDAARAALTKAQGLSPEREEA